jgi:hypothetical protein
MPDLPFVYCPRKCGLFCSFTPAFNRAFLVVSTPARSRVGFVTYPPFGPPYHFFEIEYLFERIFFIRQRIVILGDFLPVFYIAGRYYLHVVALSMGIWRIGVVHHAIAVIMRKRGRFPLFHIFDPFIEEAEIIGAMNYLFSFANISLGE